MLKRILTAVVALAVLLPFLIFSGKVPFLMPILTTVLSLVALWEIFACLGLSRDLWVTIPAYLIPLALGAGSLLIRGAEKFLILCIMAVLGYVFYLFALAVLRRGSFSFARVCESALMVGYISFGFLSLTLLRHHIAGGAYLYLLVFIGAWVTDTFAYFTGRLLGKHKLIPEISPKKTVEGAIGGTLFCMGAFPLYGLIVGKLFAVTPNYLVLVLFGLVAAVVSQLGDLIASLIKREHGIKDYGCVFPGHGGVLDRFDSILALSPVLFLLSIIGGWLAPFGL
jgi:phosphatidate cytidylyltransferase